MPEARVPLSCQLSEKVAWATAQAQRAAELRADPEVHSLLARVEKARQKSRAAMANSGMIEICGECEEHGGGSCCGAGIEDRYDGVTLLINLLLGADLPRERRAAGDCFFLGDQGCRLPARHVLCVNYICQSLTERLDAARLGILREHEGEELEAIFRLHARLTALLDG